MGDARCRPGRGWHWGGWGRTYTGVIEGFWRKKDRNVQSRTKAAGVICLFSPGELLPACFPSPLHPSLDCCFPLLLVRALQGIRTRKKKRPGIPRQSLPRGNPPPSLALGLSSAHCPLSAEAGAATPRGCGRGLRRSRGRFLLTVYLPWELPLK